MNTHLAVVDQPARPDYLTTAEVADLLRRPPETVRYWRHRGEGPASFKIGRRVLYSRADVEAFIELHRQTSSRPGITA